MAFRIILLATLVAYASAGVTMDMMEMMQNMAKMQSGGGCANGKCAIPEGVDMEDYMEQQRDAQKSKQQETATKIKAQFERVMADVTMKKHRYALGVMTEFTSMCSCLKQDFAIYKTLFVQSARDADMTDIVDMNAESKKLPYEAKTMKDAKERIFGGMLKAICDALGNYMSFADQVEDQLAQLTG